MLNVLCMCFIQQNGSYMISLATYQRFNFGVCDRSPIIIIYEN